MHVFPRLRCIPALICMKVNCNLIRIKQAVVDSELHELCKQVQHLSLQGHGRAGSVLLQSFNHQWLKQTYVVVDGILENIN